MEEKLKQTVVVDGTTQFSDLPSCLVMEILSRLPVTTLMTCRCVCKDWIRLFQEPYFIKLQLAASPVRILTALDEPIFQFGQIMEDKGTGDLEERTVNLRRLTLPVRVERFACMNSCNGLLCFQEDDLLCFQEDDRRPLARSVCVCNPVLGEWVSISTTVRDNYYFLSNIDFVFSAKNNQYKLLHSFSTVERAEDLRFEIYTLGGTGQWRRIDKTITRLARGVFDDKYVHAVLHGSVHWIDPDTLAIHCFDADDEDFRRLPLPSPEGKCSDMQQLGVINGCLCVQVFNEYEYESDNYEIWVMKEYGAEESWIMMLTFHLPIDDGTVPPFKLLSPNEDEILMFDDNGWLLSYNLKTTRLRRCELKTGSSHNSYEIAYKPSFVSLKEVAKGEEVMLSRIMEAIQ